MDRPILSRLLLSFSFLLFFLHPSSFILHPSSFILHPSSFFLLRLRDPLIPQPDTAPLRPAHHP